MLNTNQSNVLKIIEDVKDFNGNDLSNKIKNYDNVELYYMETQHLIKVIEKGASHIKSITLINCYCDLKLLSKFKKLSDLYIFQAFDYLHGQKIYRDKSHDTIMKKWLKKNKWVFRNFDKTKAYYAIVAKESIENKFKNDLGGLLKSTDLILSNFPKNFNKKIYNFKWSPFFEPSKGNFPFYFSGKDFESLGKLINLKTLYLEVDDSVNLSFIKKLKKIKELKIRFTQENVNEINLKNILPKSQNLELLMIDGIYQNYKLKSPNIEFLSDYKKLKNLTLHGYTEYIDIKTIKNLKTYKLINVLNYLIVENMNELFNYKKLELIARIRIINCDNLEILCEYLKDITCYSLSIDNLSKTTSLSPISKLTKLSSFHICHSENSINDLHRVRFSRNLKSILLSNIVLDNINTLKINKKELERLSLRDSKINNIDGLANYKKLHSLSLSLFHNNYNLRFLSKLSLQNLHLSSINNFDFTKSLPKLKSLKSLFLESISSSQYKKLTAQEKRICSKTPLFEEYKERFDRFINNFYMNDLSELQANETFQMVGKEKLDFIGKMPNLENVTIKDISIKDLVPLGKLEKLVELNLFAIDNSTLIGIGNIKNLKYLDLSYNYFVSGEHLYQQLINLKKLESFRFYVAQMYSQKNFNDFLEKLKENDKKFHGEILHCYYKDEYRDLDQTHLDALNFPFF